MVLEESVIEVRCSVGCEEEIIDVCICDKFEVVGLYFDFEIFLDFDVSDHCVAFDEVWNSSAQGVCGVVREFCFIEL